jgi:hypothetical protein
MRARRRLRGAAAAWLLIAGGATASGEALSPRNASYSIDVRLDPARRALAGDALVTWRNIAPIPATELRFHLYWNAWRDARSTWIRERLLADPDALDHVRPEDWARVDIDAIDLLEEGRGTPPVDVTGRARFDAPDDGNPHDRTVLVVPLERPVGPGETIRVRFRWRARVPRTFARTGAVGDYYFIAQWFPKIGVLAADGWHCRQFHAATEFFADFGVYDVRITVPAGWVVGATGVERSRQANGDGTVTHRYYQEDVHDFAWTASRHYLERRAHFSHPGLPPVAMRLLLMPEHAGQEARLFGAARAALRFYGEWFGPYPYGHLTIVDPAWQSGAGGMEYPTLFTAGTRWLAPAAFWQPESVTVHEAGHQFWYGIVATNEVDHAWLDEGLNTFSTARVLEQAYPPFHYTERFFGGFIPWVYRDIVLSRATDGNRLAGYRPAAEADVPSTPTFRYWPGTAAAITYNKTALWLHTLERHLGWETLRRVLAGYFERGRFRHPGPEDFFAAAREAAGPDIERFFDEVYRSSNVFDYGIERFESERAGDLFETMVVVRRYGEAVFPVEVVTTFEDGHRRHERWEGRDRWVLYRYARPARAATAEVDPRRVLLLDVDYTNNSRTMRPRARAAAVAWAARWMVWLQDLLVTWTFFA